MLSQLIHGLLNNQNVSTDDGLDDVTVIGVVTFTVCDVRSDNSII